MSNQKPKNMEGQNKIKVIRIKPGTFNQVFIGFVNVLSDSKNGTEEEEEQIISPEYTAKSPHAPHKDFLDAMKKLRKYALESSEMTVDSKEMPQWNVSEIKIAGDMDMQNSRVQFVMSKLVKRINKYIKVGPTPQVSMYPEKDDALRYHNAEAMTKEIEKVIDEAFKYLSGKYADDEDSQLPLFDIDPKLQTHFKS